MEETEPKTGDVSDIPRQIQTATVGAEIAGHDAPVVLPEAEIVGAEAVLEAETVEIPEVGASVEVEKDEIVVAEAVTEQQTPAASGTDSLGGDGGRSFTMRELLNELKEGDGKGSVTGGKDARSRTVDAIRSNAGDDAVVSSSNSQNDISMELINNVTGVDEEGRSRQRILLYAAKRYASAIEKNPEDHDAFYNWALVLQESADNVGPDSNSTKDSLLEEACKKYEEATRLCSTLYDAYYNWAIAISDRAKLRGRTKEAEELWKQSKNNAKLAKLTSTEVLSPSSDFQLNTGIKMMNDRLNQATKKYEKAVLLNWNSPQALNNWGLALQELSSIVPVREKQTIIRTAINKFRAAIQLQFDFHRAIYNLGTVLYGLAEDTFRSGRPVTSKEVSPDELYSQSAIYIAAAHALKPNYSVYHSALRLVRSMLPLPYLKVGYLTAPPANNPIAPHKDWQKSQFVLNHEGLQQVDRAGKSLTHSPSIDKSLVKVDVTNIVSVSTCADLTLPPGPGLCIDTIHGPIFLVADTWESLDGWLDAIRLVYTIFARGKSDILAGIITG